MKILKKFDDFLEKTNEARGRKKKERFFLSIEDGIKKFKESIDKNDLKPWLVCTDKYDEVINKIKELSTETKKTISFIDAGSSKEDLEIAIQSNITVIKDFTILQKDTGSQLFNHLIFETNKPLIFLFCKPEEVDFERLNRLASLYLAKKIEIQ